MRAEGASANAASSDCQMSEAERERKSRAPGEIDPADRARARNEHGTAGAGAKTRRNEEAARHFVQNPGASLSRIAEWIDSTGKKTTIALYLERGDFWKLCAEEDAAPRLQQTV